MKTIQTVQSKLDEIQVALSTRTGLKKSEVTKLKNRHQFLKLCIAYLQTNPDPGFLEAEKDRLNGRINKINASYKPDEKLLESGFKKQERIKWRDYHKIMGTQKSKEQLRSVNFLLT